MKLFSLIPEEKHGLKLFLAWHLGYAGYVALFSLVIYEFHLFKAHWLLKESWIINMLAPAHTLAFVAISPYRRDWVRAVGRIYRELDGDIVFFMMALVIFLVGFYLYSTMIWFAGALVPIIIFI